MNISQIKERICKGCGKPFPSKLRGLSWSQYCTSKCYRLATHYGKINK